MAQAHYDTVADVMGSLTEFLGTISCMVLAHIQWLLSWAGEDILGNMRHVSKVCAAFALLIVCQLFSVLSEKAVLCTKRT
jgi:hypothetical protein